MIPAWNEAGKVGRVVRKIPAGVVDCVLVVDDGSNDGTAEDAVAAGASVVRHCHNKGVGAAIRTGIDFARANGYDVVAVLSGDDQHDPGELPQVLSPIIEGQCDLVQGSRYLGGIGGVDMPWIRRLLTRAYTAVLVAVTGFAYTDATNGFRAFRISIFNSGGVDIWQSWLDRYELEPYILIQAARVKLRIQEAPVTVIYHGLSTSKMVPFKSWWSISRPLLLLALHIRR